MKIIKKMINGKVNIIRNLSYVCVGACLTLKLGFLFALVFLLAVVCDFLCYAFRDKSSLSPESSSTVEASDLSALSSVLSAMLQEK